MVSKRGMLIFCLLLSVLVASCGSSSEGPDPSIGVSKKLPIAVISIYPAIAVPGEIMTIDGTNSYDPDGGVIASYNWRQVGGTTVGVKPDSPSFSITIPKEDTTLVFRLVVTDDAGATSDPVSIDIPVVVSECPNCEECENCEDCPECEQCQNCEECENCEDCPECEECQNCEECENCEDCPECEQCLELPDMDVVVVSSRGNDRSDGSIDAPVKTIAKAMQIARALQIDTIYIMEGIYTEHVVAESGIKIIGDVTGFDAKGRPSFAANHQHITRLRTPPGKKEAILIDGLTNVAIRNMSIEGARVLDAKAIRISGSRDVEIKKVEISTIGVPDTKCVDVDISESTGVTIYDNLFTDSGNCKEYIGVSSNKSSVGVSSLQLGNKFGFFSAEGSRMLKAVQVIYGDSLEISGVAIENLGDELGADTVAMVIIVNGVTDARVHGNTINLTGGGDLYGSILRCDREIGVKFERNETILSEAVAIEKAVQINCGRANSRFEIERNKIRLTPKSESGCEAFGIDVNAVFNKIDVAIKNNIIMLPVARIDSSNKKAINITRAGINSSLNAYYNTILMVGTGALSAIKGDNQNVSFSSIGNIFLVFGPNDQNSVFSAPSGCIAGGCVKEVRTNIFNASWIAGMKPLKLINYLGGERVLVSESNSGGNWSGNHSIAGMNADFFNQASGELNPDRQALVIDLGIPLAGIEVDINGRSRGNSPDIGATEYR
jgi:hypothetical protein